MRKKTLLNIYHVAHATGRYWHMPYAAYYRDRTHTRNNLHSGTSGVPEHFDLGNMQPIQASWASGIDQTQRHVPIVKERRRRRRLRIGRSHLPDRNCDDAIFVLHVWVKVLLVAATGDLGRLLLVAPPVCAACTFAGVVNLDHHHAQQRRVH